LRRGSEPRYKKKAHYQKKKRRFADSGNYRHFAVAGGCGEKKGSYNAKPQFQKKKQANKGRGGKEFHVGGLSLGGVKKGHKDHFTGGGAKTTERGIFVLTVMRGSAKS